MKSISRNTLPGIDDLDELDRKIINYLQKNGREPFVKIGDELGVPASTVRDRTNRLVEHGILRIVGVLNPLKGQKRVMANIGVKIANGRLREIAGEIARFDEVSYLVICAGRFDLMVEVICRNNRHLLDFTSSLREIEGVQNTESFIYYTIVKEVFDLGPLDL
ncbi:MAG: Lrp/AsnC family transcriptional regulator [Chloroflexi bacterium]|nr:MAG: Lrp/AsnC family transcriptional regulator [Chloroflexota bacterium]